MRVIAAIALNTFREAIRDRILYLILGFAFGIIALARFVSMLTVGNVLFLRTGRRRPSTPEPSNAG